MTKKLTAIGLMSGTSLDGVDAALIRSDGDSIELTDHFLTIPYKANFRERLRQALKEHEDYKDVEQELTQAHAGAVKMLMEQARLQPKDVDVIGFHGQTLVHMPHLNFSKQIGDGALLARLTGINVVNDFRSEDIRNGGHGAPLVPLFHRTIFSKNDKKPMAVLNIGGVANVTYLGEKEEDILAFDTGPGNALLDDWMFRHTGVPQDEDGIHSAKGKINDAILEAWLDNPYFKQKPPKSLDRNSFSSHELDMLSLEDGAATLVEFTVRAIEKGRRYFPKKEQVWVIMGGGRKNLHTLARLRAVLKTDVTTAEDWELDGSAIEAQAFGYLAIRSLKKLPLSLPTTTGVKSAVTGGVFYPA